MGDAGIGGKKIMTVESADKNESEVSLIPTALTELGIDGAEVDYFREKISLEPPDRLVCICGHAVNKHNEITPGRIICQTAKILCPCDEPRAVVVVQDTRYFMWVTKGIGAGHALAAGLRRLEARGKWSKLLEPPKCDGCLLTDLKISPVAITQRGKVSMKQQKINVFLCDECLFKYS